MFAFIYLFSFSLSECEKNKRTLTSSVGITCIMDVSVCVRKRNATEIEFLVCRLDTTKTLYGHCTANCNRMFITLYSTSFA